jgi:hypothetical protein
MRQVEQRARPPQTLACGTLLRRLEHAQSLGHADRAAVAIGQADHAATAFVQRPRRAGQHDDDDQAEIARDEIGDDVVEHILLCWRPQIALRQVARLPACFLAQSDDGAPALVEAEQRQRWNQHGGREQERCGALEERLHAQPEKKTDATVNPGDGEHERNLHALGRMRDPEGIKLLRIELLLGEQALSEPGANDVKRDQRRDAQPQHQLQRLQRGPAELPALVERPEAEA